MSEIKRCPFCGIPLKLVGSKRRGNQHYLHEYNNNCILNGFGFTATDENIQHWNTRKPMQNIVERLEECYERYEDLEYYEHLENGRSLDFEYCHGKKDGVNEAIEIVEEEGGMNV